MTKKYFEIGTENIFSDLGIPDAEEYLVKTNLAIAINDIIKQRKLNQKDAANLLGIDQPKVSALHKGKLQGFSLERLLNFLVILGRVIDIRVSPKRKTKKECNNITVSTTPTRQRKSSIVVSRAAVFAKKK